MKRDIHRLEKMDFVQKFLPVEDAGFLIDRTAGVFHGKEYDDGGDRDHEKLDTDVIEQDLNHRAR